MIDPLDHGNDSNGGNMKRQAAALVLALLACVFGAGTLCAQDLAINNVRIVVGNGTVIERGSILISGGKITAVSPAASNAPNTIDARGMSALPGFIDAHRHVNAGPNEQKEMQALLDAGYTTILSGGGPAEGNITLRDHIDKGVIRGPRIIPSARLDLADNTPDKVRAETQAIAKLGVKWIGEIALTPKPGPRRRRWRTCARCSTRRRRRARACRSMP